MRAAGRGSLICFICNQLLCDGHSLFVAVISFDTYGACACVSVCLQQWLFV